MASERVERRLSAVLAADVAGYSRLMGLDEEGTLTRLKAHRRALIDPKITEHRGRIVKTTGDGMLVEFASVVDAVRCAMDIQRGMIERNAEVPQDKRIEFRMGVHQGDVIIEEGDIFGDGVNVAARLESISEPGGICMSGRVQEDTRGKLSVAFQNLGDQRLKNIAHPVRVFRWQSSGVAAAASLARETPTSFLPLIAAAVGAFILIGGASAWYFRGGTGTRLVTVASVEPPKLAAERFSAVVLPFANLSGDPSQDYLADVITEELTTALSRLPESLVIARSTAFTYKGKPVDVKQIGRELGVRHVLEGSMQRSGYRVRVTAQLIDAQTGAHVWADQFDEDRADLLEMQDEIVIRVSRAIQIEFLAADAARTARKPDNVNAQDLALRCEAATIINPDKRGPVFDLCEEALKLDDRNVLALSLLSNKVLASVDAGLSNDPEGDIRRADDLALRALAADPNESLAHFVRAHVLFNSNRMSDAIVEAQRSLDLNPSFISAYNLLCAAYNFLGRPEEGIQYCDKGIRLSPRDPVALYFLYSGRGAALQIKGQYDQSAEWFRRAIARAPQIPITYLALAASLALSDHEIEAREMYERSLTLGIQIKSIAALKSSFVHYWSSNDPVSVAAREQIYMGLRKIGMPEE